MCHRCPLEVPPPAGGTHFECPWCGEPFDNYHTCGHHVIMVVDDEPDDVPLPPVRWRRGLQVCAPLILALAAIVILCLCASYAGGHPNAVASLP